MAHGLELTAQNNKTRSLRGAALGDQPSASHWRSASPRGARECSWRCMPSADSSARRSARHWLVKPCFSHGLPPRHQQHQHGILRQPSPPAPGLAQARAVPPQSKAPPWAHVPGPALAALRASAAGRLGLATRPGQLAVGPQVAAASACQVARVGRHALAAPPTRCAVVEAWQAGGCLQAGGGHLCWFCVGGFGGRGATSWWAACLGEGDPDGGDGASVDPWCHIVFGRRAPGAGWERSVTPSSCCRSLQRTP